MEGASASRSVCGFAFWISLRLVQEVLLCFGRYASPRLRHHLRCGVSVFSISGAGSVYPELRGRREFCDQVVADLNSRVLHSSSVLNTTMIGGGYRGETHDSCTPRDHAPSCNSPVSQDAPARTVATKIEVGRLDCCYRTTGAATVTATARNHFVNACSRA
jgi:hypothetical protein